METKEIQIVGCDVCPFCVSDMSFMECSRDVAVQVDGPDGLTRKDIPENCPLRKSTILVRLKESV